MGLFNKDGSRKPFGQYMAESRERQKMLDEVKPYSPLVPFRSRVPEDVLIKFVYKVKKVNRDSIQRVITNCMIDYIKNEGGENENIPK